MLGALNLAGGVWEDAGSIWQHCVDLCSTGRAGGWAGGWAVLATAGGARPSPLPFPNRRASCPQEFHDCADLPGGLLPIIARLRGLRILRISDCHLFAPADANGLANLAGLQELRLQGYQALAENGMAQVRRRFRSARYQGATACR